MTTKLNFYTEKTSGGFTGKCKQLPGLTYGPKKNRDTALSGVKRAAKKLVLAQGGLNMTPAPAPKVTTKLKRNVFRIVVDRSGSMAGLESATANALNTNLKAIQDQAKTTGQETLLEVVLFNSGDVNRVLRPLGNVLYCGPISEHEIRASGGTPLWEATIESIKTLDRFYARPNEDVAYMVMVITDGDNTDNPHLVNSLTTMIKERQKTDLWTFTFLTPPGKKYPLVVKLGLHDGNVQEWEATVKGIETYASQNNLGFTNYFSARTLGATSSKAFYQTDLSGISSKQVKSALQDLSGQFKVLSVKAEADIRPFVESETGRTYVPGSAFYQLTKDEKNVQATKELLLMEKGKKEIYGGPDARTLLGLPVGQDVKVRPGNHANFDLFVQSTSNNRKLVRGTKLLVKS